LSVKSKGAVSRIKSLRPSLGRKAAYIVLMSADYRRRRMTAFLHPWDDPLNAFTCWRVPTTTLIVSKRANASLIFSNSRVAVTLLGAGVPVTQVRYGGTIHTVLLNPITHTVRDMSVCQDQVSRARENLVAADAVMSAAKAQGRERTIAARRKLSTQ
jgi:hypothetical protein